MTTRRGFLGLLASVAAAATLDPEKLLWVPGAKTISIPAVPAPTVAEILADMERKIALGMGIPYERFLERKAAFGVSDAEWMSRKSYAFSWTVAAGHVAESEPLGLIVE